MTAAGSCAVNFGSAESWRKLRLLESDYDAGNHDTSGTAEYTKQKSVPPLSPIGRHVCACDVAFAIRIKLSKDRHRSKLKAACKSKSFHRVCLGNY